MHHRLINFFVEAFDQHFQLLYMLIEVGHHCCRATLLATPLVVITALHKLGALLHQLAQLFAFRADRLALRGAEVCSEVRKDFGVDLVGFGFFTHGIGEFPGTGWVDADGFQSC
ncbi:hypothetical protein D3C77_448370 [compost metagenome]